MRSDLEEVIEAQPVRTWLKTLLNQMRLRFGQDLARHIKTMSSHTDCLHVIAQHQQTSQLFTLVCHPSLHIASRVASAPGSTFMRYWRHLRLVHQGINLVAIIQRDSQPDGQTGNARIEGLERRSQTLGNIIIDLHRTPN